MINDAPDEAPEPPPQLNPAPKAEEPADKKEETPKADDSFYQDPLIQNALKVFEGTLK